MSLNPVPGNDIIEVNSTRLTPPWRAWFDALREAVSGAGSTAAGAAYGSFYDTANQLNVSGPDPNLITMSVTDVAVGVSIDDTRSRITVLNDGIYNIQFSAQFESSSVQEQDVTIWIRKNSSDVAQSAGFVSVAQSHGGVNGHVLPSWNYVMRMNSGDYVQFLWSSTSAVVFLAANAASATVPYPATPSMSATIFKVG